VEKGRVEVQGKGGENQRIPFHKINRAVISSGNSVSTTALFWLARAKETTNENRETTHSIPLEAKKNHETHSKQRNN
jgi:CRISPR/Cas system-associated endonuclease Cas1